MRDGRTDLDRTRAELAANAILASREYAWPLFPEAVLQTAFFQQHSVSSVFETLPDRSFLCRGVRESQCIESEYPPPCRSAQLSVDHRTITMPQPANPGLLHAANALLPIRPGPPAFAPLLHADDPLARMKKDLFFLAGEECEGRGLKTDGINKAAAYIAAAFKAAGLKPAGRTARTSSRSGQGDLPRGRPAQADS